MKQYILIILGLFLVITASAQIGDLANQANTNAVADTQIMKGVNLTTEWKTTKNPFKFEIKTSKPEQVDRYEQMQLIGVTRMPDEDGIIQTYAFVSKTSEAKSSAKDAQGKQQEATANTYFLQAFPDVLNEKTHPTEEQAEQSSIVLTSEQLWFVGAATTTNGALVAIFWPAGAYPAKLENLRMFDLKDKDLDDLKIRITPRGEKISTSKDVDLLARVTRYQKEKEAAAAAQKAAAEPSVLPTDSTNQSPNSVSSTNASPVIKPTSNPTSDPVKDVENVLNNKQLQ